MFDFWVPPAQPWAEPDRPAATTSVLSSSRHLLFIKPFLPCPIDIGSGPLRGAGISAITSGDGQTLFSLCTSFHPVPVVSGTVRGGVAQPAVDADIGKPAYRSELDQKLSQLPIA